MSIGGTDPDHLTRYVMGRFDVPAFARRARAVAEAYDDLLAKCRRQREELLDEVRERLGRNRLEVAYRGDVLVGNSTVRPPADGVATVIVRVLAEHRRQGYGAELLARSVAVAHELGARGLETIVLESNVDGLRFARARGFVDEVDRYLPDGDDAAFVTLRRPFEFG